MRFAIFKINSRAVFSIIIGTAAAAAVIFSACRILPQDLKNTSREITASSENTALSQTDAEPNLIAHIDDLGDVGGEFVSDCSVYDGQLSVPANINLDRPVIVPAVTKPLNSARVSSLFGYRVNPVSGKYSFHSGYDLASAHGSNIYAMYPGRVTTASYDSGYGNYIIISHDFGYQTLYAHCSELLCEKGDEVDAGEVIALVGSTGNSTGAHLHVEFRRDGKRYDPEWILGGIYN